MEQQVITYLCLQKKNFRRLNRRRMAFIQSSAKEALKTFKMIFYDIKFDYCLKHLSVENLSENYSQVDPLRAIKFTHKPLLPCRNVSEP